MKQYLAEISAKTLDDVINRTNKVLELINQANLHTIIHADEYHAVIICPYKTNDELSKIKDVLFDDYLNSRHY